MSIAISFITFQASTKRKSVPENCYFSIKFSQPLNVPLTQKFFFCVNISLIKCTNQFQREINFKKLRTRFFRALKCSYFVLKEYR